MKKIGFKLVGSFFLILLPSYFSVLPGAANFKSQIVTYDESFELDTLTIYNPTAAQCDGDPLVTASNKKINVKRLREGSIRWMAISRDLLKRWGGRLAYGDTVVLNSGDPGVDGLWVIQDTMNKRYTKRGDLLFDCKIRFVVLWTGVKKKRKKVFDQPTDS